MANLESEHILCYYTNLTESIQIARSEDGTAWQFERIVFPGQRLLFQALSKAKLEIHTCTMGRQLISAIIACDCLRVDEAPAVLSW